MFVGWFWFLLLLAPVVGVVNSNWIRMADRYAYLSSVGLFAAAVWSLAALLARMRSARAAALAGAALAMLALGPLALQTSRQLVHWRDSITLFEHALAVTQGNYVAHYSLALAYAENGDQASSQAHLDEAIRLYPEYVADRRNRVGENHYKQGDFAAAERNFRLAAKLDPAKAIVWNNLGASLAQQGRPDEALPFVRKALELDSGLELARNNLQALEKLLRAAPKDELSKDPAE